MLAHETPRWISGCLDNRLYLLVSPLASDQPQRNRRLAWLQSAIKTSRPGRYITVQALLITTNNKHQHQQHHQRQRQRRQRRQRTASSITADSNGNRLRHGLADSAGKRTRRRFRRRSRIDPGVGSRVAAPASPPILGSYSAS